MDKKEHNNASIILSFCRHRSEDYAGLVPKKVRELSEKSNIGLPKNKLLTLDKQQNNVKPLLIEYYNSLCKQQLTEHKELQTLEMPNRKILQTRGKLSAERKDKLEALKVSYERLLTSVQNLYNTLDESIPELPVDNKVKTEAYESLKMINEGRENSMLEDMWGDENLIH